MQRQELSQETPSIVMGYTLETVSFTAQNKFINNNKEKNWPPN
jgi:hypothetical protein